MRKLVRAAATAASAIVFAFGCAPKEPVNLPLFDPMKGSAGEEVPTVDKVPEYHVSPGDELSVLYAIKDELRGKYTLQIRDVLDIRFPTLASFDSTQAIRPDGKITLPYLGDITAAGRSPAELADDVRNAYKGTLRDPEVYISVKEFDASTQELLKAVSSSDNGPVRRITVRPDGGATFPVIGDVQAGGMTLDELSKNLSGEYGRMYDRLSVSVGLSQSEGAKVFVLGDVRSPGSFRMERPRTALEAVALAGGFTVDAVPSEVITMRPQGQNMIVRRVDLTDPLKADQDGNVAVVMPGDVVWVPRSKITDLAYLSTRIANMIFFRGYSVGFSYNLLEATQSGTKVINTSP